MLSSIPATNIVIDQSEPLFVTNGQSGPLTATVTPANHSDGDVEWTSTRDDIVSVSQDTPTEATFAAKAEGTAIITASVGDGSVTNTIAITVQLPTPATNIEIDKNIATIVKVGDSGILRAVITPTNHTDGAVTWSRTAGTSVIVGDRDATSANFNASALGTSTITASIGALRDSIDITVRPETPATTITIDQGDEPILVNLGSNGRLSATVLPADHTDREVEWTSDEPYVTLDRIDATSASYSTIAAGRVTVTARVGR